MVLRYFRKRTNVHGIIQQCRHTKKHGTFTIALAVALREHGLNVEFHSDRDPKPQRIERQMYRRAKILGIALCAAIPIEQLTAKIRDGKVAIVYFDTDEHYGHFSPLTAIHKGRLILPYTDCGSMSIDEFDAKWKRPGVCRQCIIVSS
jgi:hypothetical protein